MANIFSRLNSIVQSRWRGIGYFLRAGLVLCIVVVMATIAFIFHMSGEHRASVRATSNPRVFIARKEPLIDKLSVIGTIEPGSVVNVFSPFDGIVQSKNFEYGDWVKRGQLLVDIDATELETKIRDAESVMLKASKTSREMERWSSGLEVSRARRSVIAAQSSFEDAKRKAVETERLLERGIIPKMEQEAALQQLKTQELQLTAAREDLDNTLRKGDSENQEIARLELQNARQRLDALNKELHQKSISASVTGIALPAQSNNDGSSGALLIGIGSQLTKGQNIFKIANLETLMIRARVDEIDVNQLKEGQAVEITGEAFSKIPIRGKVAHVATQALPSAVGSSKAASFEIMVEMLGLTKEEQKTIRIGMSAQISIIRYQNTNAIVIPTAAVHDENGLSFVWIQDHGNQKTRKEKVVLGRTAASGIEILEGVKVGELLVISAE